MKASNVFSILVLGSLILLLGCGKYEKNPVKDLKEMRENGKNEVLKGPDKPQVLVETVIVEKEVEVIKEQSAISNNHLVITAAPVMTFVEGESTSYEVIGRSLLPGIGSKLTAQGLPAGVSFQKTGPERYTLTWTPAYNTVPYNTVIKSFQSKITAQLTDIPESPQRKALEALTKQTDLNIIVQKSNAAPTDLAINLADSVKEDSITKFDVTVRVNGVDDKSGQTPHLVIRYDGNSLTQGNTHLERDASRHVIADQNQKAPQYLGDYKWKFSLAFDTKNISVQPAQNIKGQVDATAETAPVRMSVKAFSPTGASSPELLKKIQITLVKSVDSPKFEVLGLGQESLELTPGETTTLAFSVSSAVSGSTTTVELPNLATLIGSPKISCQVSKLSASKQDCQLSWKVPCAATDAQVTQQLSLAAIATHSGRRSEVTQYNLKTIRSQKAKAATCAAAGVAQ